MKKQISNRVNLSPTLFWDTDVDLIDWEKQARFIIERVITRGDIEDWKQIKKFYGLQKIKKEIISMRYLDKKTLNFFSIYFDVPKMKFRCYTMKQLFPAHWDY